MKKLVSLLLLVATGFAHAASFDYELCSDSRWWSSGDCPATLSSGSASSITDTTATLTVTTDRDSGALYCLTNTAGNVDDLSTIQGGTNTSVSASGVQSIPLTGLSASTTYYAHCYHEWESRPHVAMAGASYAYTFSFTTTAGGGDPYDLSGFSIPFAANFPALPQTTSTINVADGDNAALLSAIGTSGALINLASGGTYNQDLPIGAWASDVHLVATGATINGDVTVGSGLPVATRAERIKLTGGTYVGSEFEVAKVADLTYENVTSLVTGPSNDWTGGPGDGVNPNWARIAVINSTLDVTDTASGTSGWAITVGAPVTNPAVVSHTDLIIAGSLLKSSDQVSRINNVTRFIVVDSMFKSTATNAFRREHNSYDYFIGDSVFVGAIQGNASAPSDRLYMDGIQHYHSLNNGISNFMNATSITTATANDNTVHDSGSGPFGPISIGNATGSNNVSVSWDGVTLPSESLYGAN